MTGEPSEQSAQSAMPPPALSPGLQELLGRMISDSEFRREMAADPERAIERAGLELTAWELQRVRSLTPEDRERLVEATATGDSRAWELVVWRWIPWW